MKTKITINLTTIIIIVIGAVLLFGGGIGWLGNKLNETNDKLAEQKNLTEALQANIVYTKNKLDEEVATKKTLQASLDELKDQNLNLSKSQKKLLDRIENVQNKNNLISAALINTEAKLDSVLYKNVDVNEEDSSLVFTENNDSIKFNIKIYKAIPAYEKIKPTIMFNDLTIPNEQYIEFTWEDDKKYKQKPVSFSVSNSNPLIKTVGLESYAIPEVNKHAIKPTGIQKVGAFFQDRKTEVIVGIIAGSLGIYVGATSF